MPLIRPTRAIIIERIIKDMESRLTGSVALLKVALLRILSAIFGGAIHILYGYLSSIMNEYLPDRANEFLPRHGFIWNVPRKSPDFAIGFVYFTGTNGSSVPEGTTLQREDGALYATTGTGLIALGFLILIVEAVEAGSSGNISDDASLNLTEVLTGVDDIVHTSLWKILYDNLSGGYFVDGDTITNSSQSGQGLVIEGDPAGSIGYIKILIIDGIFEDDDSFTNGSVTADVDGNISNTNLISGGIDAESLEEWRSRILQRIQTPPSGGSKDDVERWAGEVLGISKGWCFSITPNPGWVTVALKASGSNIIPSSALLSEVNTYIMERICVTANVITVAIEPVTVNFSISINPNTSDIQGIVDENLERLFSDPILTIPGEDILISNIRDAIKKAGVNYDITSITVDAVPVSPSSDVVLVPYQFPVFGSVIYSTL